MGQIKSIKELMDKIGIRPAREGGNDAYYLCPLEGHNEKTASFHLVNPGSPQDEFFYCFGCGRGGRLPQFIRLLKPEIKAKVRDLPIAGAYRKKYSESAMAIININERAAEIFSRELSDCKQVRDYLTQRGITPELHKVGLGTNNAYNQLHAEFTTEELRKAGLISERNARYFAGRIVIPIVYRGSIVGFSARIIPENVECQDLEQSILSGKYVNTPETEVFNKQKIISEGYLFREAMSSFRKYIYTIACSLREKKTDSIIEDAGKIFANWDCRRIYHKPTFDLQDINEHIRYTSKHIRRLIPHYFNRMVQGTIIVVEGVFDQMVLQEKGFPAVALMGLGGKRGYDMIARLARTKQVIILLDGDEAGEQGLLRLAGHLFRNYDETSVPPENIGVVFLPPGKDPDDFVLEKNGVTRLLKEIVTQQHLVRAVVAAVLSHSDKINTIPEKRAYLVSSVVKNVLEYIPPSYQVMAYSLINQRTGVPIWKPHAPAPKMRPGRIPVSPVVNRKTQKRLSDTEALRVYLRKMLPHLSQTGSIYLVPFWFSDFGEWFGKFLCEKYPRNECEKFLPLLGKNSIIPEFREKMMGIICKGDMRHPLFQALNAFVRTWIFQYRKEKEMDIVSPPISGESKKTLQEMIEYVKERKASKNTPESRRHELRKREANEHRRENMKTQ